MNPRVAAKDDRPPPNQAPATGGVRFAPSPTGRFHVGNLRTAWISFQWARHLSLPWVIRFEDIDRPRVQPEARTSQISDMRSLGMVDELLLTQSLFHDRHWQLFVRAIEQGQVYPCDCSRREVQTAMAHMASAPHNDGYPPYSGHCRHLTDRAFKSTQSIAWRFKMPDPSGCHDFIVGRTDPQIGLNGKPDPSSFTPSYHWACAVDDFDGRYELIVRSSDLKAALPLQRSIQAWLSELENLKSQRVPSVFHTALVTQNEGRRLEKRTAGVTWPELQENGMTAHELIALFEKSLDRTLMKSSLIPESVLEEAFQTISLEQLGVKLESRRAPAD